MGKYEKEEILRMVEENKVEFIYLQFTDILGALKSVAITKKQLPKALENKIMFDGSSIEGFARIEESDMYLHPDLDTFVIIPWSSSEGKAARLICNVFTTKGEPFEGDPRYQLKKVIEEARELGYTFNVGAECEFFLFHRDENGKATDTTHDTSGYFALEPNDLGGEVRRKIIMTLSQMGYEIETSHHEVASGQHEIDFRYDNALKAADDTITFRLVVKAVSKINGLCASFMPKPLFGENGSGMHTNMSLMKHGKNVFYDPEDPKGHQLSEIAYHFIGGIMEHVVAMTAVNNPLVNSYKRLVPGYEAPVYVAWSCGNRSPLIRVPASREEGTRIELRSPDSAANPYLVFACCLKAGLEGIKKGKMPPEEFNENIFAVTKEQRKEKSIKCLPRDLKEALGEFQQDTLIKEAIGQHIYNKFLEAKEKEWEEYCTYVGEWEVEKYLNY